MSNYNFNNKVNTTNTQASENEQKNIQDKSGIDYLNNYPSNRFKKKNYKDISYFWGSSNFTCWYTNINFIVSK